MQRDELGFTLGCGDVTVLSTYVAYAAYFFASYILTSPFTLKREKKGRERSIGAGAYRLDE